MNGSPNTAPRNACTTCGAMVEAGEYHPFEFCVLVRMKLDPWQSVRKIAAQLNLADPGPKPPKVWEIKS